MLRRTEALEAQLANKSTSPAIPDRQPTAHPGTGIDYSGRPWAFSQVAFGNNHNATSASSSSVHNGPSISANLTSLDSDNPISAQSPTAFLEMLSSAASAHHPARTFAEPGPGTGTHPHSAAGSGSGVGTGLKEGRNGTTMVTGGVFAAPTPIDMGHISTGSGLTPFFTYDPLNDTGINNGGGLSGHGQGQGPGQGAQADDRPQIVSIDSDQSSADPGSTHRRESAYSMSGSSAQGNNASRQQSGVFTIPPLTPSAIFNFPPTPIDAGPAAAAAAAAPASAAAFTKGESQAYVPQYDEQGNMKPSDKLDGPWRAVETADTLLASANMSLNSGHVNGVNVNVNVNGNGMAGVQFTTQDAAEGVVPDLPPMDDAMQQQLLMDLFWPGWPANLPEPNIVNDLYVTILSFFHFSTYRSLILILSC